MVCMPRRVFHLMFTPGFSIFTEKHLSSGVHGPLPVGQNVQIICIEYNSQKQCPICVLLRVVPEPPRLPQNFFTGQLSLSIQTLHFDFPGGSLRHDFGRQMTLGWCVCDQSCPTLYDLVDCSPPGSSVHGISQARILEWVAISSSRGSSPPRN